LLNRYGQVVGIIVGIANPTEQEVFIGIGFAVPINIAASSAGLSIDCQFRKSVRGYVPAKFGSQLRKLKEIGMDQRILRLGKTNEQVLYEVKKVIVGQDYLLERLVVALLRKHILAEGVGLAKTMAPKRWLKRLM
jgi:hypothetical protein